MKKCIILIYLFQFLILHSVAGNKIVIQNFNEKYGFPSNMFNCMCMYQDSKGILWFGMANGLYKFDLNSFTYINIQKNKINGFPEVDIRAIIEISPGLLLVGTYKKGLLLYNSNTDRFDKVRCNSTQDLSNADINCLHIDKTGTIWVGTFNGLYRFRYLGVQKKEFEYIGCINKKNTKLNSDGFVSIKETKTGKIWFLTLSDIGSFNSKTNQIQSFPIYMDNRSFCFVDEKRVLISNYGKGLRLFNTETYKTENIKISGISDNAFVRYVFKDSRSNIWLSVSNIGLILLGPVLENPTITNISNKDPEYSNLNSNVIYQIGESSDGALWICNEGGINIAYQKENLFQSYSIKSNNNPVSVTGIRSLCNSGHGFVWVGTIGGGLKQFNFATKTFTDVKLMLNGKEIGKNIQAIINDHKDNLWLGTEGEGVIKFSPDKKNGYTTGNIINYRIYPESFPAKSLLNDFIMCLLEDRHKNIWIGTWYGLSLLDSSEVEKSDQSEAVIKNFLKIPGNKLSISNNTVMNLLEDKQGNIWVGTQEGLNRIVISPDGYHFEKNYQNRSSISLLEKKILTTYQSKNGNFWFSTQDGGISNLDLKTGIAVDYNSENRFNNNIVNSISEDSNGSLWLGTNNGICRFNISNQSFNTYTIEDGLISENFLLASNCNNNNWLYFGSGYGITIFNPSAIVTSTFKPNLIFTDFRLFNVPVIIGDEDSPLQQHISNLKSIILNYNQNFITIAFSSLNYLQSQNIRYSCKLEGFEKSWNNLGKEHKVTYNNLLPGNYVFKVMAFNSNNQDNNSTISLSIIVKPPFWKTTMSYIIYLVIFILLCLLTYWFILQNEKQKNSINLERLNAQRIHEIDLLKVQFFTQISHEFRTPLTLLSAPLESLINNKTEPDKAQNYYQLMLKNVQRLIRLVDQLLDLRKVEEGYLQIEWNQGDIIEFIQRTYQTFLNYAEKRNIQFTFHTDIAELFTFFDPDKLDKVLFNLISNALKYTFDFGTISLKLNVIEPSQMPYPGLSENYLEFKIADSGYGIPKESLSEIFNPFQQVNANKPIGSGATGIGLALTKELIELHKGFISVESEVDKGSVFTIYLPVYKDIPQKNAPFNGSTKQLIHKVYDLNALSDNKPVMQNLDTKVKASVFKPLVLIVEDNSDLRIFIKNELQDSYRIIESENGQEGLEQALSKVPDLIISDIMMDKMDGIELCSKLKSDEHTSHIPIILLTARHSDEIKINSYELGADDFITKPFNIDLLITRIKNLIEQRRKLRKLFGNGNNFDFTSVTTNNIDAKFIEKLNLIIEKNISNPDFDPTSLASSMAMSRMQLYRKVTALTNQSVYNYIRTIRLNRAAHLLVTTDIKISEIAFSVGYTEPSNFSKCFTRQFNQTPSQFAREKRK